MGKAPVAPRERTWVDAAGFSDCATSTTQPPARDTAYANLLTTHLQPRVDYNGHRRRFGRKARGSPGFRQGNLVGGEIA